MSDRPTAPEAHLILVVDGRRLVIDPRVVREVIHVCPPGDAAGPPPDVEAMRRRPQGPIMPVINLRRALGYAPATTMRRAAIVVVEADAGPVGLFLDDGDAIESYAPGTPLDVRAVVRDALHARTAAAS